MWKYSGNRTKSDAEFESEVAASHESEWQVRALTVAHALVALELRA